MKCPDCGANLDFEDGRKFIYCSYCGTKIVIKDENEYTYRTIDEAKIREAELSAAIKLKELETEQEKGSGSRNFFKKRIIIYVIMAAVGYTVGFMFDNSFGMGFMMLGGIGLICVIYGSIIHGIILLVNRKKK